MAQFQSRTGQSRGCGKVEYASVELAEEAVLKLNGKALSSDDSKALVYFSIISRDPPENGYIMLYAYIAHNMHTHTDR